MIIRHGGGSLLLITQPDHAALGGRMMRRWQRDALQRSARRDEILIAVEQHDHGWSEPDASPIVDVDSGKLLDFMAVRDDVKRDVWPRAVAHLAGTPYAAALVAHHAIHVYRRYRPHPEWSAFFKEMERLRADHIRASRPLTLNELFLDYRFVRLGDLLSLTFCNAWTEPQTGDDNQFQFRLDGDVLRVSPDPFAGAEIPFEIDARQLPDRAYSSSDDAATAFAAAPIVTLRGALIGSD